MKKKLNTIIWFVFLIAYLELIFKGLILKSFLSIESLYIVLFSIPIALLFYLISSLFNEKINKLFTIILSIFLTFIFIAQAVYYTFYQSIFSIFSILNGAGQVLEFTGTILSVMGRIWYVLLLMITPLILFLIFKKKIFSFKKTKLKKIIIIIVIMIILFGLSIFLIKKDKDGMYSMNRVYSKTHVPTITINKLGLLTTERLDLQRFIFGFEETIYEITFVGGLKLDQIKEDVNVKYNEIVIDFDSLIKKEKNSNIIKMHKYFDSLMPTAHNEYTGMFEGKNLILITAEGFDTIALDPELTPTLYMMANNGFVFKNFYQPLYPVSTSDGEYMNITGLIPKEGVWSGYRSSKVSMPFAVGNMFKKIGYKTNAYHNHAYTYYDRELMLPNMGFHYEGCGNGIEKKMKCGSWPASDLNMINGTYKDYINKENFATYYMTVSGHLNYNKYGNSIAKKNWDYVKNIKYSDAIKAYMATQIELDKAMESLLNYLKETNKLDDTLIVISPDHYPYGLTKDQLNERSEENRKDSFLNYHTTLIMYNSVMDKVEVDKVVSSIDIIPTIYNLFGLKFDSRLLIGRDIFADEEGLVILSNRSWITDKGTYNSISEKFTSYGGNVSQEYINSVNEKVYQKFTMSGMILDYNYYSKLGL